ncbi:MAG TPA: SRPBCC domain-containing protein [Flavisolibacter sp.]|nr:SRPBCC domain-containing protein [Flavisolibacter sp.]
MNEQAQQIGLQKEFATSKESLYRAWTEDAALKQWWKPMNKELVSVENDIQPGGKVAYTFENDLKIHGEYKEVQQGEKLVYSWIWDLPDDTQHKGEYLLTIGFSGNSETSRIDVLQENFRDEHSVQPHRDGWEGALEDLKRFVEGNG